MLLDTKLLMSTAAHPETDGQTERVNRVLEDVLRSYATSFAAWSSFLPLAEFAINNVVHASTGLIPFFVNNTRHPRVPAVLALKAPTIVWSPLLVGGIPGGAPANQPTLIDITADEVAQAPAPQPALNVSIAADIQSAAPLTTLASNFAPKEVGSRIDSAAVTDFLLQRQAVTRYVRDALQAAVDKQKENADRRGRKNTLCFRPGERVLLSTAGIQSASITNLGALKLAPRFIGPFKVIAVKGDAYTLDIPTTMRLRPT